MLCTVVVCCCLFSNTKYVRSLLSRRVSVPAPVAYPHFLAIEAIHPHQQSHDRKLHSQATQSVRPSMDTPPRQEEDRNNNNNNNKWIRYGVWKEEKAPSTERGAWMYIITVRTNRRNAGVAPPPPPSRGLDECLVWSLGLESFVPAKKKKFSVSRYGN